MSITGRGTSTPLQVDISVVIPTFNEEENIEKLLRGIDDALANDGYQREIVVVDDNSPDGTSELVSKLSREIPSVKLICRSQRLGIGSAIVDGMKNSSGKIIVTMDADFSHPPESIPELLAAVKDYDIVVGSRYVKGGGMNAPFSRIFLSRLLNRVRRLILGLKIRDLTGGFMAIKREVIPSIDTVRGKYGDYAFDLLYKAKKAGFKIIEAPFTYEWRINGQTKTSILRFGPTYLRSALRIRFNDKI